MTTPRDELLNAIDQLADAVRVRDLARVEKRRRDARALVLLHVPAATTLECDTCGQTFSTGRRLAEHLYVVHGGDRPAHWVEEDALVDAGGDEERRAVVSRPDVVDDRPTAADVDLVPDGRQLVDVSPGGADRRMPADRDPVHDVHEHEPESTP
jgi:hypothetical protein